jgi:hypothetical protein
VPYRCFYSRNVENLFMAGRDISVTHEALGTTRVMKTCGMMGEVVGKAASICVDRDCTPRDVYAKYWSEMDELLRLPGKAYRATVAAEIVIPKDALPLAGPNGPPTGLDPATLPGLVVDDRAATKTGNWTEGTGLKGYVGYGYVYAGGSANATIRFELKCEQAGRYDVRVAYQPHENRATNVPVEVTAGNATTKATVNMREQPPIDDGFVSVGTVEVPAGGTVVVTLSTAGTNGNVHADAVQLVVVE